MFGRDSPRPERLLLFPQRSGKHERARRSTLAAKGCTPYADVELVLLSPVSQRAVCPLVHKLSRL
jgi:hypothetical protein